MYYDVTVIGLGYVGLTFATALADVGYKVLGVERRSKVVELTNSSKPHFSEIGLESIMKHVTAQGKLRAVQTLSDECSSGIYVITVGTPLGNDGKFNVDFIRAAAKEVAGNMEDGALVILRSTVAIGTARNIVAPILQASGKSFQIAMCPERTLEGKAMQELRSLPQIIGADDDDTRQRAAQVFDRLTPTVVQVGSLETAEIIKLVDNTYRDIQFGFANEVAQICDAYGVNAIEVINGGKLGYPRTNVALPGLVGGPCLEKDPHILAQSLEQKGLTAGITKAARYVNERQPIETCKFVVSQLAMRFEGVIPRITVAGVAFKGIPETDDLRGSMALRVIKALRDQIPNVEISVYDPVCTSDQLRAASIDADFFVDTLDEAVRDAHCMIIANNHPKLGILPPEELSSKLAEGGFIFDYWNHFSQKKGYEIGNSYYAVGNTRAGKNL